MPASPAWPAALNPTGSAGQANRELEADPALTLNLDNPVGADQPRLLLRLQLRLPGTLPELH